MTTLLLCCQASAPEGNQTLAAVLSLDQRIAQMLLDNIYTLSRMKELNRNVTSFELCSDLPSVVDLGINLAEHSPEVTAVFHSLDRDGVVALDDEAQKVLLAELEKLPLEQCTMRVVEGGVHWRFKLRGSEIIYDSMQLTRSRLKAET